MSRTVHELLRQARKGLAAAPFEASPREAGLLLGHVLGLGEAGVLARRDEPVSNAAARRFQRLLRRRLTGEPVAHLFGEREFYGRPFTVDRRVLVPRPETEHLVEAALALDLPPAPRILDIGTGSGCIALTLALEIPGARLIATDISLDALEVFRANRRRHRLESRAAAVCADLTAALDLAPFDLVVSNPPYIDRREEPSLSPEVTAFEPHAALFPPDGDGRSTLTRLLAAAPSLRPGTHLLLEIGYDQGEWLAHQADATDGVELVEIVRDLAGLPRTAVLRRV